MLEPANAGLALLLGQVQKGRGRLADAEAAFAAATRAAPGSVDAWLARGGFAMEVELAAPAAPGATGSAAAGIGADALARNAPDRLDVAIDAFARAEALAPSSALVVAQHAMALRYACAWRDSGAAEARLAALGATAGNAAAGRSFAVSPLMAAALLDDPDLQRARSRTGRGRRCRRPRRAPVRRRRRPPARPTRPRPRSSPAAATACASATCRPISTITRRRT